MDITTQIQGLIDALKADKSMAQPWRNYALSDALRLQAVIKMGLTQTNQTPPPEMATQQKCICQPDMPPRRDCPIHGTN